MTLDVSLKGLNVDAKVVAPLVDNTNEDTPALAVATRNLNNFTPSFEALLNDTFGADMNQTVTFAGTPVGIYNGQDSTLWTPSTISGNAGDFDETNTDHAHGGIVTISDYTGLSGDTLQVNGTNITNTTLTEGVDWTAATSNNATASSLATAIDGISGVSASANAAVITVTADANADITTFTESDAANMPSSAQCLGAAGSEGGDIIQFAKGSDIDFNDYVAITGWIYITGWAGDNQDVNVYVWDTDADEQVGTTVSLSNFIDRTLFNTWQKFSIALSELGAATATSVDALRVETIDTGAGAPPNYFMDDMQVEETGTPLIFSYSPDEGKTVRITNIAVVMVDNVTEANAKDYNSLMGVNALANGITVNWTINNGENNIFGGSVTRMIDFVQFAGALFDVRGDGTNSWVTINYELQEYQPIMTANDVFSYTINDDLSGLLLFRVFIRAIEIVRPN